MSNLWVFNEDKSGLTYALSDEVLQDYTNLFKKVFPDISTEPSTAIGQIISALAQDDISLIDKMRETSDYFFNGGSGLMLDIWAYNNFRVARKNAIPSNVIVTIYGKPKVKIPKGFVVSDGTHQYYTELDYVIPLNGELDVLFVAKEVYTQASLANTITQILNPIDGVDRVNNSNPSNIGLYKETDSQLFLRCMELGSTFRNASLRSILANISQIDGVIKVGGFENKTNKEITERNVKIPPHSFIAVVLGGDDKAIAESISYSKPVGAGTFGNTAVEILVDNKQNTYYFERPSYLALKVSVVCKLSLISPKSYVDIVKEAVLQYVDKLEIGDYITQPSLSQAISSQAYNFEIVDVKFGTKAREVVSYEELTKDRIVVYIPYTETQTLYTYKGSDPAPGNYTLYQATQTPLYTKETDNYVEFNTPLYTKTNGSDDPNMEAFSTPLFYKRGNNDLYEKTGGGSMPQNYQAYNPSEALFYTENEQYLPYNKQLYIKVNGSESGEMTLLRDTLYTKKIEVIGGSIGYTPIQLDLNQLALINSDDISVSGD